MRFLLLPLLLAAAMCVALAQELPTLKWNARDQQSLMKGTWWEANAPLLPPVDAAVAPSASVPEPSANADSPAVDPVPEDFTDVNEYFLPDYIRTSTGLIDPQKLLTEVESNDVIELIKLIKSRYNVNLFVSVFAAGQKVPPSVNAPTIARQIFKNKERNLLLHFHMGDIKSAQIALDPELSAQLGDAGRRDLLYQVKQDASRFTNPQDELVEAMISLARRTEADMASAPKPSLPALDPDNPASIPEANITIQEPEEARESHLHAMMKAWMSFALANVAGIILHVSALVAIVALWLVWKNKRVVRLLPSEPDKRLGAPHGASQSRPVNYCMQDGRGPDSIGRRQMRQHMRDVS